MNLKELLGEQLFAAVKDRLGGRNLILDDGMLIPKYRFDCVNVSLREHKKLVKELAEQNDGLKKELEKAAEKLTDSYVARRLKELKMTQPYLFYGTALYRLVPVDSPEESETKK